MGKHHHPTTLEVTVLSAQSLKKKSSFFSLSRLRPYAVLSLAAATTAAANHPWQLHDDDPPPLHTFTSYRTRVDEHGADNPTWGDTVRLPVDAASFAVDLFVLSKHRRLGGPTRLGWCRIPSSDIVEGLCRPAGSLRRHTYALRNCRHGGRGHGLVHVEVRLVGPAAATSVHPSPVTAPPPEGGGWGDRVAIGIPVVAAAFGRLTVTTPGVEKVAGNVASWREKE